MPPPPPTRRAKIVDQTKPKEESAPVQAQSNPESKSSASPTNTNSATPGTSSPSPQSATNVPNNNTRDTTPTEKKKPAAYSAQQLRNQLLRYLSASKPTNAHPPPKNPRQRSLPKNLKLKQKLSHLKKS